MSKELQRITTEYIVTEDRLRLSGELDGDSPVVVWLTRRLLLRLVPALCRCLERQARDVTSQPEALQDFAQQAARAGLQPQAPVRAGAGSTAWLAHTVDLNWTGAALALTFRSDHGEDASLVMNPTALRQWLSILYATASKAEWPADCWPAWLREGGAGSGAAGAMLH